MVVKTVLRPIDKLSEILPVPGAVKIVLRRELRLDSPPARPQGLAWMNR
jgi:hypothetical protein